MLAGKGRSCVNSFVPPAGDGRDSKGASPFGAARVGPGVQRAEPSGAARVGPGVQRAEPFGAARAGPGVQRAEPSGAARAGQAQQRFFRALCAGFPDKWKTGARIGGFFKKIAKKLKNSLKKGWQSHKMRR
ncbi:hypothetical protein D3Z48_19040 [Clostridiaceae bacterium]|nr:hypothetical protein [Clostridiaceae bacterium]